MSSSLLERDRTRRVTWARWSVGLLLGASAVGLAACDYSALSSLEDEDAGPVDAPGLDVGPLPDVWAPDSGDAGRDAPPPPDAWFDCGTCDAADPCFVLACDPWGAEPCQYEASPDGTSCGMGDVCVAEMCVERECGDGWRERGDGLPREGCDDGNTVAGDGCDAMWYPMHDHRPCATRVAPSHPARRSLPGGSAAHRCGTRVTAY